MQRQVEDRKYENMVPNENLLQNLNDAKKMVFNAKSIKVIYTVSIYSVIKIICFFK